MLWLANGLMVLFWVGLSICYYATRGVLHGKNHMSYFIDLIAIPACLISNIVLTCFYAVIMHEPFGVNMIFWSACFAVYVLYFIVMSMRHKQKTKKEEKIKNELHQTIQKWIESFSFLTSKKCNIQVYLSKGKPVGKVFIDNITNEQYYELKAQEEQLSTNVHILYGVAERDAK
jgi:Ca2+/Na+ antiporter